MIIEYVGSGALVQSDKMAFTFEVKYDTVRDRYFDKAKSSVDWDSNTFNFIGNYKVFPYGINNDLPDVIKQVVKNNYIAPGILTKKTQLLWGVGPKLYTESFVDGKLVREWINDPEITNWLESWGYEDYLLKCCVDYHHVEGTFSKYELSKGSRIGKNFINKIVHIAPDKARLSTLIDSNSTVPTHVITTDWNFNTIDALMEYKVYPVFDFLNPFQHRNSVLYSNMYSFCTDYYTIPDLYGTMEWLKRSTATPLILKAFSKNAINMKYHIVSPAAFWDKKREDIQANCVKTGKEYNESMLVEYKEMLLNQISDVLTGEENVGKYLHTTKSITVMGTNLAEHGWEVKTIDQNIKDFVEAQIKISERSDYAVAGGLNLHGALGNISGKGTADSGSEQLYALKNYLLTGIDIPEMIVMKPLNYAIRANFPNKKGVKLGFYHNVPEKEQDIAPKDRIKNNV
jgi:hypothetical protein